MSYETDLFEVLLDLCMKYFLCKIEAADRALNDLDLAAGQIAKMILFLIVFFTQYDDDGEIKFSFHPAKQNQDAYSYYTNTEWVGIAWLTNQIYLIFFERQYVFNQFSYTFKRLVFQKIFGLVQNGYALYSLHQDYNIKIIYEGSEKFILLRLYATLFLLNLFLDTCSLIILFVEKFFFKEKHEKKKNYVSYGGLRYFLGGFIIGLLFPTFIFLHYYLTAPKDAPKLDSETNQDFRSNLILNFSCLGLQVFFLLFYIPQAYKEQEAEKSKKFICFTYGLSFAMMNTYNSAFIFVVVALHFSIKISFCCCFIAPQQRSLGITFLYCCTPNIEDAKYQIQKTEPNPDPDPALQNLKI